MLFSQIITLYITPAIYLALDRYSGSGPLQFKESEVSGDSLSAPSDSAR